MIENETRLSGLETSEPVEVRADEVSPASSDHRPPVEKRWRTDFKLWTADEMRALLSTPAPKNVFSSRSYNWTNMQR